ncbi:MAG: arginine--tRNA ligase [Rickettsiales bacterium]|nr:arginine--tRNA ligase [Rickettsiales bacterium]
MNIYNLFKEKIAEIVKKLYPEISEKFLQNFAVEAPKDTKFGDLSTNIAMVLAKPLGLKPQEIANNLIEKIKVIESVQNCEIADAGFINISLDNKIYYQILSEILSKKNDFGKSKIGKNAKVNLEFLSANPTGPMHIGHARNAVVGDVLANILIANGYNVTKEYYVNDAGGQIETLAKSAFLRYKEKLGVDIGEIPKGLYPGEYLIEVAEKFIAKFGNEFVNDENYPEELKTFAISEMLALIKFDLANLGVNFDVWTSEKKLYQDKKLEESLEFLTKQNLLYHGILEAPKGKPVEDYEPREQLLFKAKDYGDDTDRPLQKSDGTYTYFSGDIAYHFDKISRGFEKLFLVLGADHAGYVKRLGAVVSALSNKKTEIKILLSQLVKVVENGLPVKMSKRAGNFITMSEVLEKVGKDVLRFIMLTKKSDTQLDFDLAKVLETSKDNPVFYVQYAYARINSVKRKFQEIFNEDFEKSKTNLENFQKLNHHLEISLIKKLSDYPKILELSAVHSEPHRISFYLYELASDFHQLWNVGKDEGINFVDEKDKNLSIARVNLINATQIILRNGLRIMGVTPVEKM